MAKKETFEISLKKLEETVERLEQGELPLEEALACFEAGVSAAGSCQKLLQEAELKVEKLRIDDTGEPISEPFSDVSAGE